MAITSLDGYIAAPKQILNIHRTASVVTAANTPFSTYQATGTPGAGVLAGTSTTAGALITSSTAGFPKIQDTGLPKYYISRASYSSTVAQGLQLYDLIYKAGAYSFNANVTLSAQPSIAGRVPGGTDYSGTVLMYEAVTASTGIQTVTVTYTNQDGVAGRTTGAVSVGVASTVGRRLFLPLQSGDKGVQKIDTVVGTGPIAGTFNILIARSLHYSRAIIANSPTTQGIDQIGLPEIFQTSALDIVSITDGAGTGALYSIIEIASG